MRRAVVFTTSPEARRIADRWGWTFPSHVAWKVYDGDSSPVPTAPEGGER